MRPAADVIVVGAGLAGLVATAELAEANRRVILLEQEPPASLGGQAMWSFGGLFLVDSKEQRWLGVRDSGDLAWQDWVGTAGFDRPDDRWPRRWAEKYVDFAATENRQWLRSQGVKFMPNVGWAERGGYNASGPGNSVPRFHVTWGTGPALVEPFARRVREAVGQGLVELRFRHRVGSLTTTNGVVEGVSGEELVPSNARRGMPSSREAVRSFDLSARAVIVATGGIGANHEVVRFNWPQRLGGPPSQMICGVPPHVDGCMTEMVEAAGGRAIHRDRMWHYADAVRCLDPIWPMHGVRIIPGPSSLWLDATGRRLPVPLFPGFDTLGVLEHVMSTGHEHSWFVLSEKILQKEFELSGAAENPDLTQRHLLRALTTRIGPRIPETLGRLRHCGPDFVEARDVTKLVDGMNALTDEPLLEADRVRDEVGARDREMDNPFTKDLQVLAIRGARRYFADRLTRVASPHKLLDPAAGPLIAVKLHILTRKTLGGLETDLDARVLRADGEPVPGLYAAGEVAGFGGGGMHGYRALEGTFLGGCLFSGRIAGCSVARALR